jgi:sigma-70-like protein/SnoaL-like protein
VAAEPVVSDPSQDPARHAEQAASLSLAFLLLLERLSPEQRAVLLLRDAFDYGYDEIAAIVGKSEAATRQLAARARRHVGERRPRFEASSEQRDELARRFFAAARDGDLGALEALLADDIVLHGDGGGRVPALARSLHGRSRVARTLLAWARQGGRAPGVRVRSAQVNGHPGAVVADAEGRVVSVMALDIAGGEVHGIFSIVNPDKLGHLGPVGDVRSLLGRRAAER